MFVSAFFFFFLFVSSDVLYSAAVEKKDLPLTVGLGFDQGLHCAYSEVTNRFKTVITVLTTQNRSQEKCYFEKLNNNINKLAHTVPAELVDAQMLQDALHRKLEGIICETYTGCKAQLSALIVLLHTTGVWRVDYCYEYDSHAGKRAWSCNNICGVLDPSNTMKIVHAGFRDFDFFQPYRPMSWREAAEHQVLNNQGNKAKPIPSAVVLLLDLKKWHEYFKKKQGASWMHTLSSFDVSRLYRWTAYLPSFPVWQAKQ